MVEAVNIMPEEGMVHSHMGAVEPNIKHSHVTTNTEYSYITKDNSVSWIVKS